MFSLFTFTAWQFALAGAVCAAGPIIIHLLNRRRFKVIEWAAMDFLREAMQRNRRIMQIRDILLLLLRTAAVLLFGLALARPFYTTKQESLDEHQPVHAILVLDNSLSMGYTDSLNPSLLERAKERAKGFIDKLPAGSKISIIPVCGAREGYSPDPHDTKANALEALARIETVDRSASILQAANEARKASEAAPQLAKRIVFFSDQQALNWRDLQGAEQLKTLPVMQAVDVSPTQTDNTWIADIRLQDGLADVETPATIVVRLERQSSKGSDTSRRDVTVKLWLGEAEIASKLVTLEAGSSTREVDFEHTFNSLSTLPEPGKPVFVALKATIDHDNLPADDERFLAAPVVAALPVVFIDQFSEEEENPARNRLGETRHLRQLLAPKAVRGDARRQLVKIKHLKMEGLNQDVLADARLVVIAGVASIDDLKVQELREYVKQGGQLVIAAGADFNPESWNATAWKEGLGILPAPFLRDTLGETPEAAGNNLKPFFLAFDSLAGHDYFQLANVPENDLRDLYSEPFFFKAAQVDLSEESLALWRGAEVKRLAEEISLLATVDKRQQDLTAKEAKKELTDAERKELRQDEARLRELRPQWLTWAAQGRLGDPALEELPADPAERQSRLEALVKQRQPRVLARFDEKTGAPFLLEQRIGQGSVITVTTGLLSSWNTLPQSNAWLIFDRILRGMIQDTLPPRNFPAQEKLVLPLLADEHDLSVTLARPGRDGADEPLDIGYVGRDQRGVTVTGMFQRGEYRVTAYRGLPVSVDAGAAETATKPAWEIPLVVNGDPEESQLDSLPREKMDEIGAGSNIRWVGPGDDISLAGATIRGPNTWWYLVLTVFICLLVEMGILAWPMLKREAEIKV